MHGRVASQEAGRHLTHPECVNDVGFMLPLALRASELVYDSSLAAVKPPAMPVPIWRHCEYVVPLPLERAPWLHIGFVTIVCNAILPGHPWLVLAKVVRGVGQNWCWDVSFVACALLGAC